MRALILGANGQVGRALARRAPEGVDIIALGADALDITDRESVLATARSFRPDLLMNGAAYTAVDRAEDEEERAKAVNTDGVANLAEAAREVSGKLIHLSTDFVFDGLSSAPYPTDAAPNPLSAYGRTKLGGERAAGPEALIVRTGWVYAASGHNFLGTMLRLMRERSEMRVVADQIGTPTYALSLAAALWALVRRGASGIYHYTDSGVASWYDFAVAIQEEALSGGLLKQEIPVLPITTAEYPTPAVRPRFSVLDKSATFAAIGGPSPHWRHNLRLAVKEIGQNG